MNDKKWFFTPPPNEIFTPSNEDIDRGIESYVFTEDIAIAINVAYVTKRPLLVEGEPGCGKSRLAEALAAIKGWHFLNKTITSRTTLDDLTNEYDHLRRLHDAHAAGGSKHNVLENWQYNRPGVFWWAFNFDSAINRGKDQQKQEHDAARFKGIERSHNNSDQNMVLLIDEIDKAEPDLPNDLLDVIERQRIELTDGSHIEADQSSETFTIITSNRERKLPAAFLRRCVHLYIDKPNAISLKKIALSHFGDQIDDTDDIVDDLIKKVIFYRDNTSSENLHAPGTSEFLDALKVCKQHGIKPNDKDPVWLQVEKSILKKKA
jgi:MoxR-like ATPase